MKIFRSILFCIVFVLTLATLNSCNISAQEQATSKRGYENTDSDLPGAYQEIVDPLRAAWLPPDAVIDTLNITPGMQILDLGAGAGTYAFFMADELKGTGHVYATDIGPSMVDYMNNKAEREGYSNVTAVLVHQHSFDRFYKDHTFDLILSCESIGGIFDIRQYFSDLRSSLAQGTGRLYLISGKRVSPFIKEAFDFNMLVKNLASRPDDFPVISRLDPDVLAFLNTYNGVEVPVDIQNKILDSFNKMLSDRRLPCDLIGYYFKNNDDVPYPNKDWIVSLVRQSSNERDEYTKVLFGNLDEAGVFDREERPLSDLELEQLQMLNKRLLSDSFPVTDVRYSQGYDNPNVCFRGKNSLVSKIEAAGYKLVKDHDTAPQCYFLEFKRAD